MFWTLQVSRVYLEHYKCATSDNCVTSDNRFEFRVESFEKWHQGSENSSTVIVKTVKSQLYNNNCQSLAFIVLKGFSIM